MSDTLYDKKNIAYLQDIMCNNPLLKDQLVHNSVYELIDMQLDNDNIE